MNNWIDLEQTIITGRNIVGKEVSNSNINSLFIKLKEETEFQNRMEKMATNKRLTMLLHATIDMKEDQVKKYLDSENDSDKKCVYNMSHLGIKFGGNSKRKEPAISKAAAKEIKRKAEIMKLDNVRSAPKLEGAICSLSNHIFTEEFQTKGNKQELPLLTKAKANYQFGKQAVDADKPNMIVFVIGGLGQNEIGVLEELAEGKRETQINHNLILGSTSFLTPRKFVEDIENIGQTGWLNEGDIKLDMD